MKWKRNRSVPIDKPVKCERCNRIDDLEREHIIPLSKGGIDETSNLRYLCLTCHDYRHARDKIVKAIKKFEKRIEHGFRVDTSKWKLKMWRYRLDVLNELNPVGDESMEYVSYWSDKTTHTSYWYYWCVTKKRDISVDKSVTKITDFGLTKN